MKAGTFGTIDLLRTVLRRSARGMGVAASFVGAFLESEDEKARDAVRRTLLGTPLEQSIGGLAADWGEAGDLLRFVVTQSRVDAVEASRSAERLSALFERWAHLKERRAMEMKVMEFRGLIVSAVAGVVVGMLSTLAPFVASFQATLTLTGAVPTPSYSPYEGGLFLLPSAVFLGLYLSPRRPYLHVALSLAAFGAVTYFLGPLTEFGLPGVGG